MDQLDQKIIANLANDARRPLAQIAKQISVPSATVHQRVKRLQEKGVIRSTRLIIDWEKLGFPVLAMVSIALQQPGPLSETAARLTEIPWLQSCYATTGEFDLTLVVRARSSEHLGEVLETIRATAPGPSRTVVVLGTFLEGRLPPLDRP